MIHLPQQSMEQYEFAQVSIFHIKLKKLIVFGLHTNKYLVFYLPGNSGTKFCCLLQRKRTHDLQRVCSWDDNKEY